MHKLIIAAPVDGRYPTAPVAIGWASQVFKSGVPTIVAYSNDVVRARNRLARQALDSDATHVLWWDSDVIVDDLDVAGVIRRLLDSAHHCVGGAYSVKRIDGPAPWRPVDAAAPAPIMSDGCAEVSMLGFGFMLTSRQCLEAVAKISETYVDTDSNGERRDTPNLFGLRVVGDELVSEDWSFCSRYREAGGRVHMFVGAGFTHAGVHGFKRAGAPAR